jgi:hypothetical protein
VENTTTSIFIKPSVAFNRGDTFVFGSWVCTADGAGSFQRCLTMTPDPKTGLVMLPEVITGNLARKFGETSLYKKGPDLSPTRPRRPHGRSHASRLVSHRVLTSRSSSTSHMASAMLAGPMRRLSLYAGLAR